MHDSTTLNSSTQDHYGTTRWMSPELLDVSIRSHHRTKYSDCYALGMVIYEVLSGRIPFYQYTNWSIPAKVVRGDRPGRPEGAEGAWFADDVWEALERCWVPQPKDRSSVEDVLQCLEKASRSWTRPSLPRAAVPSRIDSPTMSVFEITTEQGVGVDQGGAPFPFIRKMAMKLLSLISFFGLILTLFATAERRLFPTYNNSDSK